MNLSLRQIVLSILTLALSAALLSYVMQRPAEFGSLAIPLRALIVAAAVGLAVTAIQPLIPRLRNRPLTYCLVVGLPALLPVVLYYGILLPGRGGEGIEAEQIQSELISDRSSNGIIEIGFSYPIFTPTLTLTNNELFTRSVNVFLQMVDANNETVLFRAVRDSVPGASLSVEATVQGMLSENELYLFLPIAVPPRQSVTGRVVFIISNLDDGTTFTEALGRAYQATFQLRDPESGELLMEFPLDRM